ncbi:MAG: UDP-N-acetylmuramoyl-L-alanyl-D-glutamate--2,6-diaminopimelate ligase [Lachnospiraceae bacterium]|nr:UDP-N-acetylmuramoyl-L-alanyl-D-glutamate--2,6-diaminopimelate ligase [Lachnospiraceae bacterium]
MKLSTLLEGLEYDFVAGGTSAGGTAAADAGAIEVTAVVNDTRKVVPGCLFICITGARFDAHEKAGEAAGKGARVIVTEKAVTLPADTEAVELRVKDTRYAMALISAAWFDYPAKKLKTVGITGTKGKTTTTWLIRDMLTRAGRKCGLIGTIEYIIGEEHIHATNTTPESYDLQEMLARMVGAGCDSVVMEVSSQALMLHRTAGIQFDIGIFTNLEADHIGEHEHKDFADYMHCKSLLFTQCDLGIVNMDDAHCEGVTKGHTCKLLTYGFSEQADLRVVNLAYIRKPGALGAFFDTEGELRLHAEICNPGKFSVYNALSAIAVAHALGCEEEAIRAALKEAKVKGRIEMIPVSEKYTLMIDYAHNAMALKSLLTTLRDYRPGRLVCLFGCGGNRARDRRFEMGEVSGRYADLTIITSDNPRDEDPQAIIDDIKTGMAKTDGEYIEIIDRREAIRYVMAHAEDGDIIVLAGKGHEDYQEINGVKYPMDERDIVREIAEELRNAQ